MNKDIDAILTRIGDEFREYIEKSGRNYLEVDIGKKAESMGHEDIGRRFRKVYAVVPLKSPVKGMKVRIDGRTFSDYSQFDSGVAVPGYVAREAGLTYSSFRPLDSMILNFT